MDDFNWWKKRVEQLAGKKQEIAELYNQVRKGIYVKGTWAFKKLLILAYYIDIFTLIAKKRFNNVVYIDLCAGPGFNYLEDIDLVVAGSPLLAKLAPRLLKSGKSKSFDKMILIDLNSENCNSLEQIVDASILCADCNSDDVMDSIHSAMSVPKSIFLAFVDPEGLEVHWKTLERLFEMHGDIVINYPFTGVGRLCGSFHGLKGKTRESTGARVTKFFGTDSWKQIPRGGGMSQLLYQHYLKRVQQKRGMIVEFPVMGEVGGFQYRIIVAAKKTSSGSPWMEPIVDLRDRVTRMTSDELSKLVDIYKGDQTTLFDF
ncbi:MAG: three-Cys-motif partner protein TcmP [Candidatus Thorarchaeota archaeon]